MAGAKKLSGKGNSFFINREKYFMAVIKRILLCCILLIGVLPFALRAQEREPPQPPTGNASNLYAEFLGPGIFYSINYDARFSKSERGLGFRIGAGGLYADGDGYWVVPFGLNYLLGANGNYFELGGGAAVGNVTDIFGEDDRDNTSALGYMSFGYRRQAFRRKGILFRAAFTPLFGNDFFIPYASVGVGFRF